MATILIVDDDPNNRLLVATLLRYAKHTVLEAAEGAAGLELARSHVPALIIVDLFMPGMDGVAFVRALRADAATARVRVALYTGTTITGALADFIEVYEVAQVIPKPTEPEEFLSRVDRALRAATR